MNGFRKYILKVPLTIIVFFSILFFYISINSKINFTYYDEFIWPWRGYFFDLLIKRDFGNPLWQGFESIDQPKLAEYSYGLALYPEYLLTRNANNNWKFIEFLISKGFWGFANSTEVDFNNKYLAQKQSFGPFYNTGDDGDINFYTNKYGNNSISTLKILISLRILVAIILSLAVIVGFHLVANIKGVTWGIIFAVIYATNSIFVLSGLKVHSEALYVFLVNLILLLMLKYFSGKHSKKLFYLIFILIALLMSTKLTGILFFFIFWLLHLYSELIQHQSLLKYIRSNLFKVLVSFWLIILIFTALNPFTYSNPIKQISRMYLYRQDAALAQQKVTIGFELTTPIQRIFSFFYVNFNSTYTSERNIMKLISLNNINLALILAVPFVLGAIYELYLVFAKKSTLLMIGAFFISLIAFSLYVVIGYERYYAPLSIYVAYLELNGLIFGSKVIEYIYNAYRNRYRRIQNQDRFLYK